jgi:hypothetical protein
MRLNMKHRIFGALAGLTLAACQVDDAAVGRADFLPTVVTPQVQVANARPIAVKVSCGLPARDSYTRSSGVMTFTLRPGDTGKCGTDAKATKSPTAKSMERAEVMGREFK